jgi:NIMA (never in mitosis gene a)-related kinase
MKDFQVLNKLGEGAFSIVYKAKRLSDEKEYALKKVKMSNLSLKEKENALNEVRILASIKYYPNPIVVIRMWLLIRKHSLRRAQIVFV